MVAEAEAALRVLITHRPRPGLGHIYAYVPRPHAFCPFSGLVLSLYPARLGFLPPMSSPRWNNDILHDICEHLAPSSFPSLQEDRSGLVALARCARASSVLFQPAVDVLWRQVDSLDVLLNILTAHPHQSSSSESSTSSSVWHSHVCPTLLSPTNPAANSNPLLQTLDDNIDDEAHARLRYYASRVRRLAHRADTCRIHADTIARLHAPLRGASLFPALLVLPRPTSSTLTMLVQHGSRGSGGGCGAADEDRGP